jgi:DNA polymerase (family 10)
MENADVSRIFAEMADILELTGGNPFKVRAYRQAAQVIDTLPGPVAELCARGELEEVPSIGARIAEHVAEILEHGDFKEHERLASRVPPGVVEMLALEGVGPKTVGALWKRLGVKDLAALEEACRSQRILKAPRMGPTRARAILEAVGRYRARQGRTPLHRALAYAESLLARLRSVPGVSAAEAAGSLRRRRETVGDLDLLVASTDPEAAIRAFGRAPEVARVLSGGPTKSTARLRGGLQVDLRVVAPGSYGAALHYFTGSKTHNIAIRTRAVRMGLKLSEYGIFDRRGRRVGGAREEEVFRAVGLPFIPPELREGAGEIEAAEAGRLPRLVEESDLLGDLHVHTRASSDARSTLEEMAEEARRLGRRYLAVTDHSRSRPLGLDVPRLARHAAALRALDHRLRGRPHLLAGIEVDILADGSLDLRPEALKGLDWVVASIHTHFTDSPAKMTQRMVRALGSGVVHALGHPSGRQIGARDPCEFDLERVLEAARKAGAALEVNAMPDRLDLNDKGCQLAKEAGVPVVIGTDAHNASQLGNLRYGLWVARRGWLAASDVLNTLTADELRRRVARRSAPRAASGARNRRRTVPPARRLLARPA